MSHDRTNGLVVGCSRAQVHQCSSLVRLTPSRGAAAASVAAGRRHVDDVMTPAPRSQLFEHHGSVLAVRFKGSLVNGRFEISGA